jgi:hypothetical protein
MTELELTELYRKVWTEKNLFVARLRAASPDTRVFFDPKEVELSKRGNWFIMFAPLTWGCPTRKHFSGIHYALSSHRYGTPPLECLRLSIGVEKPIRQQFKESFKSDVVKEVLKEGVLLEGCRLWPEAGFRKGTKLFDTFEDLDDKPAEKLIRRYSSLTALNAIIAMVIQRYNADRRFECDIMLKPIADGC